MKLEKMKSNKSGYYIPAEYAMQILDAIDDRDLDPEFIHGAACVLAYLSCPDDSNMKGVEFPEFLDNGLAGLAGIAEKESEALAEKTREFVEKLEESGFEVVEARIVKRGDL